MYCNVVMLYGMRGAFFLSDAISTGLLAINYVTKKKSKQTSISKNYEF